MRVRGELIEAQFIRRLNRFACLVEVEGRQELAHLPNSGRMRELLYPGASVLLRPEAGLRKTAFDLVMVRHGPGLISVDARLPATMLVEALGDGRLRELGEFHTLRREVRFGTSRLDLLGHGPGGPCLIEAKSVTLVREGVALFPDAPTSRGARHLEALRQATEEGYRAAAVFVIQREDARAFSPFEEADPAFASALRAVSPAVLTFAYTCRVSPQEISILGSVPVVL